VENYDALQLDDVYAVITYYLRHRRDVDQYLATQLDESETAQAHMQSNFPIALRDKLLKVKQTRTTGER
jgi:putative exporter of polyketide antibiotics